MPLELTWTDLALRLLSTLLAGAIVGYNRGEHGKAAGLCTTMLVCLAAAVAMLQVNFLLPMAGKHPDSFVTNDLMRLPLGILTGVGFIGAGAILRRQQIVVGLTTAATLWFVTVLGLCFGGGQLLLGWLATGIGCCLLWGLKWIEKRMVIEFRSSLTLTVEPGGPAENDIRRRLREAGLEVKRLNVGIEAQRRIYAYEVIETRPRAEVSIPPVVETLGNDAGVAAVHWTAIG